MLLLKLSHRGEKRKKLTVLLTIALTMSVTQSFAQININTLSANIGAIRTFWPNSSFHSKYQYALYPEFNFGGEFFTTYFQWRAYFGFWDDGIDHALPVADMVTYSYGTRVVGFRLNFLAADIASRSLLPTGIFIGLARHFISVDYVGGFGLDGKPGQSYRFNSDTFESGLNIEFHLAGSTYIQGEMLQYFPLDEKTNDILQKNQRSYKVGLAFKL